MTETRMEELARGWARAELVADTDFLGNVLTDDFIAIGPLGFMLTKDEWLLRHTNGNLTYESLELDEMKVRDYGDAAMLTGRQRSEAVYRDGERRHEINDVFRISMFFTKSGDAPSIVGLHLSPIAGPPAYDETTR